MQGGLSPGSIFEDATGLKVVDQKGAVVPYSAGHPLWDAMGIKSEQPYKQGGYWFINVPENSVDENTKPEDMKMVPQMLPVVAMHPGAAPTAPAEPTPPSDVKKPNLTQNDIEEIRNPGLDPSQLAMRAAQGYIGKSALAGDTPASRNSAFANLSGDDPNNLHDAGILARTIAGQL